MNQKYIQRKNSTIHTYNNLTLTNKLDDTLTFQYDFISIFCFFFSLFAVRCCEHSVFMTEQQRQTH